MTLLLNQLGPARQVATMMVLLSLLGGARPAFALDGTGPALPPDSDDMLDPVLSWRAARPGRGAGSMSAAFEVAGSPLVRFVVDPVDGSFVREPVLDGLVGVRLGGRYALSDRVEIAAAAPIWGVVAGESGVRPGTLGDVQLAVPVGLAGYRARPDRALAGGASIVPYATLPTGSAARYLGDGAPSLGASLVGEARQGRFVAVGHAGLDLRMFEAEDNLLPGPGLTSGASIGWRVFDRLGLHATWRSSLRLRALDEVPDGAPRRVGASELGLTGRVLVFNRIYSTAGLSGRTQDGPGAATARVWLGLGGSFGGEPPASARPLIPITLDLSDPVGEPVEGARVTRAGVPVGMTDAKGQLELSDRWSPEDELDVTASGFEPIVVVPKELALDEGGAARAERTLAWAPVDVRAFAQDAEGRPLPAVLVAEPVPPEQGVEDPRRATPPITLGGAGSHTLSLSPGVWTVRAQVSGFGMQERGIRVRPRASGEEVRFILLPNAGDRVQDISVVDVNGGPVGGASVDLDGQPVGTTGSGGTMRIAGLSDTPITIDAEADTFRELTRPGVVPGASPMELVLARERGAVRVVVRDGDGEIVQDASARFLGADRLGPFALGQEGQRSFVLRPGGWQLLVSSPEYGLQQRSIEIPDQDAALQDVEIVLQPPESGSTDLTVRVVDRDNRPVPNASVSLDGLSYGATSSGGELVLSDLLEGDRALSIGGAYLEPLEQRVPLYGGLQEHTAVVDWKAGTTLVLARGPEGMVGDATARFRGPAPVPPAPLGMDGVTYLTLAPGSWQALVESASLGFHQTGLTVPAGPGPLQIVDAVLNSAEAGQGALMVKVSGPDGKPVQGARVSLDRLALGATASSGTLSLSQLSTGPRTLRVELPPYAPVEREVQVTEAGGQEALELAWGVGAVRLTVTGDGGPAADAQLRLGGPSFVPATPVGADGRRLLALSPGRWQVLAASPRFAPEQAQLLVPDAPGLTELTLDLKPPPAGVSELVVRVQDPDGKPIPGASVAIDDRPAVDAKQGLAVLQAAPGAHRLRVQAPSFLSLGGDEVKLVDGLNERIVQLEFVPRRLDVQVLGPDGPLQGATVRLDGPAELGSFETDARGRLALDVRPGTWTVLASAPELGVQAAEVVLSMQEQEPARVTLELRSAQVEVAGSDLTIQDTIYFDTGKATLKPMSRPILDEVAATLKAHPEIVRLVVEGHTDTTGEVAVNMRLSRNRAAAVVAALIRRGIAPERLDARGFGPTRPVVPNDTTAGRAANRRVELHGEVSEQAAPTSP